MEAQSTGGGVTIEEVRRDLLSSDVQLLLPTLRRDQNLVVTDVTECAFINDHLAVAIAALSDGRAIVVPAISDEGAWRRARAGDGAAMAVLTAPPPLEVARVSDVPSLDRHAEREVLADMSNELVVVDEQIVVKWQFVVAPGSLAGPHLVAHLMAVGFNDMPTPVATVSWGERLVASAAHYLPNAVDGWEWMVDDLMGHVVHDAPTPAWTHQLGALVGRLHRACATSSTVIVDPVGFVASLGGLATHYQTLVSRIPTLDEELRMALDPWRERMNAAVHALEQAHNVVVIPIHGDLHAGQFLRWRDGVAVSDFDGNPLLPMERRGDRGPAAFDVACLLRSLDHVAHVVAARCGVTGNEAAAERALIWVAGARSEVLAGYRETGDSALLDEQLMNAFESLSPLHEAVYATDYLPRWRYVPLGVLRRGW